MLPEMAQIGFGGLRHLRLKPVVNRFSYPLFFVRLPMHELTGVAVPGFSIDRFNLLSFHHRDHGEGGDALRWVRDLLQAQGLVADGAIWLTTFPPCAGLCLQAGQLLALPPCRRPTGGSAGRGQQHLR
jgi:DUF1365 family protein